MTEIRTVSETGGEKGVKPERFDLIPVEALEILARLYGFGAEKYEAHNWRKGYEWSKSYASLQRHASAFWRGEDLDAETGLPHLAGVAFHAFTLMVFMDEQPQYDDRFTSQRQKVTSLKEAVENIMATSVPPTDEIQARYFIFAEETPSTELESWLNKLDFGTNYLGGRVCVVLNAIAVPIARGQRLIAYRREDNSLGMFYEQL